MIKNITNFMERFYKSCVVLSNDKQHEIREKKDINIKRLKDGLKNYNTKKHTSFSIAETRVQGSMAMFTSVQTPGFDNDIDVAIVFEYSETEFMTAEEAKQLIVSAMKPYMQEFKTPPEIKNSCVRIRYQDGYHVDFAVFRRYKINRNDKKYYYEHAGEEWTERDIDGVVDWFNCYQKKYKYLRAVIRLAKTLCLNADCIMPGGLILTALCIEALDVNSSNLDEVFYNTMVNIISNLEFRNEISIPVDNNRLIVPPDSIVKCTNFRNLLIERMKYLKILFSPVCDDNAACIAWGQFFHHSYWDNLNVQEPVNIPYTDTEEFIEDMYLMNCKYKVKIKCLIHEKYARTKTLSDYIASHKYVLHGVEIECLLNDERFVNDTILWKVRNVGPIAEQLDEIRGEIKERGHQIKETASFNGNHFIECYVIRNEICIAVNKIGIPIKG